MTPKVFDSIRWRSVKALLEWELSHELTNGWSYLFSLFGYAGVFVLLLGLRGVLGEAYIEALVPGVVVALALRPFLNVGTGLVGAGSVPRKFLSSPVPAFLFVFKGFVSGVLKMIVGLSGLVGLLALTSFPLIFFGSWAFWGGLLIAMPGALGLGGVFTVAQLFAGASGSFRGWGTFLLELLGGVFFRPGHLPVGLAYLSYVIPHYYPIELARMGPSIPLVLVAFLVSTILCFGGFAVLVVVLEQKMIGGRFHRVT